MGWFEYLCVWNQKITAAVCDHCRQICQECSYRRVVTYAALTLLCFGLFLLFKKYMLKITGFLLIGNEAQGYMLFLLSFALVSFPLMWGYIFINVAAGYRYGFLLGGGITAVCVMQASLLAFIVCRRMCSTWMHSKIQGDYMKAIMTVVEGPNGFKVIALTRMSPLPFGIQNGLFAVTNVPTLTFIIASSIGLFPTQLLNSYVGSTLRSLDDLTQQNNSSMGYCIVFVQVFVSIILTFYIVQQAKMQLNKTIDDNQHLLLEEGIKTDFDKDDDATPLMIIEEESEIDTTKITKENGVIPNGHTHCNGNS
ncbi:transmembrane protein 64-like [Anneissia japonica]|uniref:transmembrane protein 64-like n=1 Tax=Anneissia japonica TaxID=1529436 RepID=UPI0014258200|nr:transmembrane protein 64-like [Anneissia japonica]